LHPNKKRKWLPRSGYPRYQEGGTHTAVFLQMPSGMFEGNFKHNRYGPNQHVMITRFLDGRVEVI
jgi:hypothetical protein